MDSDDLISQDEVDAECEFLRLAFKAAVERNLPELRTDLQEDGMNNVLAAHIAEVAEARLMEITEILPKTSGKTPDSGLVFAKLKDMSPARRELREKAKKAFRLD